MLVVALTGNYGMGKSTVLALFKKYGAVVIDSDEVVRSLLNEQQVLEKIVKLFGDDVFFEDGKLDKEKLADIVFGDDALRHSLEDILHPLVFERINSFLSANDTKSGIAVVEVPLLFERGYENRFDRIVSVVTDEKTVLRRLEASGFDPGKALRRLRTQLPMSEKERKSDFIIDNMGTPEETEAQVEIICRRLLKEERKGWK